MPLLLLVDCLNAADFHDAWEAMDTYGTTIINGVPYELKSSTATAVFTADVGYKDIYPACDLALYQKRTDGTYAELRRENKDSAKVMNGKYSLVINIKE